VLKTAVLLRLIKESKKKTNGILQNKCLGEMADTLWLKGS